MSAPAPDPQRVTAAAKLLLEARRGATLLDALPADMAPRDLDEALAMQDALASRVAVPVAGWKIGATAAPVQAKIGLAHPFHGRVFADTLYASGIALPAGNGHNILEAEIAVRLARDLPPARYGHTRETVAEAVGAIIPCIEINRPSFRAPFAMRGLDVIADNGSNAGLVLGAPVADWRGRDLAAVAVVFRLDGEERAKGAGAAVMGHPFAALAWLADERAARGKPLRAGDIVATGSMMGFVDAKAGQTAEAVFAGLGAAPAIVKLRLG